MKTIITILLFLISLQRALACIGDESGLTDCLGESGTNNNSKTINLSDKYKTLVSSKGLELKAKVETISNGDIGKKIEIYNKLITKINSIISGLRDSNKKEIYKYLRKITQDYLNELEVSNNSTLKDCSKGCDEGYFCYNSQYSSSGPNGQVIGKQEGDFKCHKICSDSIKCDASFPECKNTEIIRGDLAEYYKLCFSSINTK